MLSTKMTMAEALRQAADSRPDQEALVCGDVRATYGQLLRRVEALARGLHELELGKGDKVVALLEPGPEFVYLFFAVARLGAVIVPLDPQLRPRRLSAVLHEADPMLLVTARSIENEVLRQPASLRRVIFVAEAVEEGGKPSLADLMISEEGVEGPPLSEIDVSPDDLLALLYTSGTTGAPKGAMHSHRSLIAPVAATLKVRELWKRPSLRMLGKQIKALARYRERLLAPLAGSRPFYPRRGGTPSPGWRSCCRGLSGATGWW
jgi:acyl-CoA synthetase (AMP-forming)/AMP-acid ligase II